MLSKWNFSFTIIKTLHASELEQNRIQGVGTK
jgi:hypothetical protein